MTIEYEFDIIPGVKAIVDLYKSSGIKRPIADLGRIAKMYANSNLIITAWDGSKLVGISRSLTDYCFSCYLSDLAVKKEYQKNGIGEKLINLTKEKAGEQAMLLLLSAPAAMGYYLKVGLEKVDNGFVIKRVA
jgi:ribosomal protein S18 acetylase RimI-like enzyme